MTSLLDPNASVRGVPNGIPAEAPTGFLLGDHAKNASDVLEAKYNPRGMPLELGPIGRRFEAYQNNGGTVVAVSGKDYTIVASDTRLGQGYSIPARYVSRIIKLTNKVVLASSGMQADIATLHKVLRVRLTQYVHTHGKEMSLEAVSQMLSNMLYYRRFQPYYTFNVLGGLDESGTLTSEASFPYLQRAISFVLPFAIKETYSHLYFSIFRFCRGFLYLCPLCICSRPRLELRLRRDWLP